MDYYQKIESRTREYIDSLPDNVTLVGAVKTRTPQEVLAAVRGGLRHLGHNYLQEGLAMQEAFKQINLTDRDSQILNLCKWHVIGHVQSNKAKKAVQHFDMIQSVDSIKLLNKINKECALLNKTIPILLEINMGNETNKTGIAISDLPAHIRTAQSLENVDLKGLMAMGSFGCSKEQTNSEFMLAKQLFESFFDHNTHYLSMGMSDSFKDALNKGSNMIRLGTILFGQR